jgi:hypothetical protein
MKRDIEQVREPEIDDVSVSVFDDEKESKIEEGT